MIDTLRSLEIYQIVDDKSSRLWGYFNTEDNHWVAFWCVWKQSASFKDHGSTRYAHQTLLNLRRDKIDHNGYTSVDVQEILTLWPNFGEMMNERFTWFKLYQLASL